ncbi:hypothetical protein K438DRAFT_1983282 [Mycena galopus ATCC 62051]|nr:hypothetical protein K438DRAFT_1983282 [Mycena galopus ATCC 62051]
MCWDMISASLNTRSWLPPAQIAFQPHSTLGVFPIHILLRVCRFPFPSSRWQTERTHGRELRRQHLRLLHRHPPPHEHGMWLHPECAVFHTASPTPRALLSIRSSSVLVAHPPRSPLSSTSLWGSLARADVVPLTRWSRL